MRQDQPVAYEVPNEAGGVIPSAVHRGETEPHVQGVAAPMLPTPSENELTVAPPTTAQEAEISRAEPPTSPPQGGWAEAAFDPGDLVARQGR